MRDKVICLGAGGAHLLPLSTLRALPVQTHSVLGVLLVAAPKSKNGFRHEILAGKFPARRINDDYMRLSRYSHCLLYALFLAYFVDKGLSSLCAQTRLLIFE